jgi:hypothetical protein
MTGMRGGLAWILAVVPVCVTAQQAYDPLKPMTADEILLGRVRVVAAQAFARLPNFTCVETIERSRRAAPNKKYEFLDTIRLEVAYVDGKELYSWPGETRFEERDLPTMVGGAGAIGTGDFALHAKSVLLGPMVVFQPAVAEEMDGRAVYRFDFRLSIQYSGYMLRIQPNEGPVGFSGSTWHDKTTLDLLKLEVIIDEIPANLPLRRGEKRIHYKRTVIGEDSFLLPVSMDMTLTHANGSESRNAMTFASCRQYMGESTLIFEEPAPDAKPRESKVEVTLPGGLGVPLRLRTPLELAKVARGDLIETETGREVKRRDVVLLPKGARVRFRVSRVACYSSPISHCWIALLPERFEFENKSGGFKAQVDPAMLESSTSVLLRGLPRSQLMREQASLGEVEPGAGIIVVRGERQLASGYQMLWRTLEN